MATSDSPLSVPDVTLAVARGAGNSGGSGSITWQGAVAHGEPLTISDSESRFGTRTNVKPLYVSMGNGRSGSALGRIVDDVWRVSDAVSVSSAFPVGQIGTSVKVDMTETGTNGGAGFGPLSLPNPSDAKPIIQHVERYYDFLNNSAGTNDLGDLNLKITRVWADNGVGDNSKPNAFSGYRFGENTAGNIRMYVEASLGLPGDRFYWENLAFAGREWGQDEFIFHQSSAINVADGNLIHIRDGAEVNIATDNWVTRNDTYPNPFSFCYLDQISNGVGTETVVYYGYQCWDDEYNAVYLGDAATRSACTKLTRQPQTAWTPSQVSVNLVESQVPLSGAYLYFRTGMRSWLSDNGVAL